MGGGDLEAGNYTPRQLMDIMNEDRFYKKEVQDDFSASTGSHVFGKIINIEEQKNIPSNTPQLSTGSNFVMGEGIFKVTYNDDNSKTNKFLAICNQDIIVLTKK